jgi:hypothetical protein
MMKGSRIAPLMITGTWKVPPPGERVTSVLPCVNGREEGGGYDGGADADGGGA